MSSTIDYATFETAFLAHDMAVFNKFEISYDMLSDFMSRFARRAAEECTDHKQLYEQTVPHFVHLAEYLHMYGVEECGMQVLVWTLTFCRFHSMAEEWIGIMLRLQLVDLLSSPKEKSIKDYMENIRGVFQEKEIITNLPQVIETRHCYTLANALWVDKPSYKLGRGHVQLAEKLYLRLLQSFTLSQATRETLQDKLDVVRFILEIWDQEMANRITLYTEKRKPVVLFLRTMLQ